jgi:hypothetical protein
MANLAKSPKNNPAGLFQCHYDVVKISCLPTGGFCAPTVDGKYIINNTNLDMFVCNRAGNIFRIPPLDDDNREVLLRQFYYVTGAPVFRKDVRIIEKTKNEDGHYPFENGLERGASSLTIEPPLAFPRSIDHNFFTGTSFSDINVFEGNYGVHRLINHRYFPLFTKDRHNRLVLGRLEHGTICTSTIYNKWQTHAKKTDDYFTLSRDLRSNNQFFAVFDTFFTEDLNPDIEHVDNVTAAHKCHTNEREDTTSLLDSTYTLYEPARKDDMNVGSFFVKRDPCIVYENFTTSQIERSHSGIFMPHYGFTISKHMNMENKAMTFTTNEGSNFASIATVKLVVDAVLPRGKVYTRHGHMVLELHTNRNLDARSVSNKVYLYTTNFSGEEVLSCVTDWNVAAKDGVTCTVNGSEVHMSFYDTYQEALESTDPITEKKINDLKVKIESISKDNAKLKSDNDKHDKANKERYNSFWSGVIAKPLTTAAVAMGTMLVGYLTKTYFR